MSAVDNRGYPEHIERMLDVMLCLPRSAWGLVLAKVEKKIGKAVLQTIILRVYEESDRDVRQNFKRAGAMLNRETKRTQEEQERKRKKAPQRDKRA
jgi:hypothetical protein